jgi:hypothetical protein
MLFPKYALKELSVGSGSIIGKGNIEEFFNHVSMHKDVDDRSLADLAVRWGRGWGRVGPTCQVG